MAVKKGIYKVDNGDGTFDDLMLKTTAEQVIYKDGKSLQYKFDNKEKIWDGAYVFTGGHLARLSKNIKDSENGLILRWSAYTGGVIRDYNWCETFISKDENIFGRSLVQLMADTGGNLVTKTVYVTDNGNTIKGHDDNGRGNNNGMVLREVIAV